MSRQSELGKRIVAAGNRQCDVKGEIPAPMAIAVVEVTNVLASVGACVGPGARWRLRSVVVVCRMLWRAIAQ